MNEIMCLVGTVWKLRKKSATKILREIKFDGFEIVKTATLTIFQAFNLDFCHFLHVLNFQLS